MNSKSIVLIIIFVLVGCGKVSGKNTNDTTEKAPITPTVVNSSVCGLAGGEYDQLLKMCDCGKEKYFNDDKFKCEPIDFEFTPHNTNSFMLSGNSRDSAKHSYLEVRGKVDAATFLENKLPNILFSSSNPYLRYLVDGEGLKTVSAYNNLLISNVIKRSIQPKYLALTSTFENFSSYVDLIYYENQKHLESILAKEVVSKNLYHAEVQNLIPLLEENLGERIYSYDKAGCITFCTIERKLGEVEFLGKNYTVYYDRQYAKSQIVSKNLVLYPQGADQADFVISLDYSLSPNLVYEIKNITENYGFQKWSIQEKINVLSPFTLKILVIDQEKKEVKAIHSETQNNSIVMCDAGISAKYFSVNNNRFSFGPYDTSILGWTKNITSDSDRSYGLTSRGKYNLGNIIVHAETMIEKHDIENIIPIDHNYCFTNFSKLSDSLLTYDATIVNLSMSFLGKNDSCKNSPQYKTIKTHPDFLWVLSAGNEGTTINKNNSYACPQNTDLKNTLVIASSNGISSLGEDWVDLIYPNSHSTSEAALLTSNLLRNMKEMTARKLSPRDLKKILIMTADDSGRAVKSKGVINPSNAIFMARHYKGESAEDILVMIHRDSFSCWGVKKDECIRRKVLYKFKERLERYRGEF